MEATQKQIDYATTISEWVGVDLPTPITKESLWEFIAENEDEFKQIQNKWRYSQGKIFSWRHFYHLSEHEYIKQSKNPETI